MVAELDYLVASRHGTEAELKVLRDLSSGGWDLACLDALDLTKITNIVEHYATLELGVADASNIFLADRHQTRTIATLDHRHLRTVTPLSGGYFHIVP